jgi:ABC-type glycerol-3-phosphate transport system substrate-binding protein
LATGKTAFEQQGSFRMPLLRQKNVNFGVVANPVAAKGDKRYADGGGHSLAVLRTDHADQTAAAVTFAKYFSSTPAQLQMALTGTMFPINGIALQDKSYQDYLAKDPQYKVYADELPNTGRAPTLPSFQKFTDTLGAALLDACAGKKTPSEAHAATQPLLQGILDQDLKQG